MREIFSRVCSDFDAVLIEIDGEKDPVHLLVNYVPKTSVSRLVNSLKGVSSRIVKKNIRIYGVLTGKMLYGRPVILPLPVAVPLLRSLSSMQYIDQQKTPL